jgi:hypothetical protein
MCGDGDGAGEGIGDGAGGQDADPGTGHGEGDGNAPGAQGGQVLGEEEDGQSAVGPSSSESGGQGDNPVGGIVHDDTLDGLLAAVHNSINTADLGEKGGPAANSDDFGFESVFEAVQDQFSIESVAASQAVTTGIGLAVGATAGVFAGIVGFGIAAASIAEAAGASIGPADPGEGPSGGGAIQQEVQQVGAPVTPSLTGAAPTRTTPSLRASIVAPVLPAIQSTFTPTAGADIVVSPTSVPEAVTKSAVVQEAEAKKKGADALKQILSSRIPKGQESTIRAGRAVPGSESLFAARLFPVSSTVGG